MMRLQCVSCKKDFIVESETNEFIACEGCGFNFEASSVFCKYNFDELLFREFGKKYLLNKALNNNG